MGKIACLICSLFSVYLYCLSTETENLDRELYTKEISSLWASISDICHPSLNDYLLLDTHLKTKRSYLLFPQDPLYEFRLSRILGFQLLGPNQELPYFEDICVNVTPKTENRCILLFASRSGIYPDKAQSLIEEIKKNGYSGHILLQIGGFPNTENEGLKLCHIPYAFKAAFIMQAKLLGFKHILWLDLAIHPLNNLEMFFGEIRKRGYLFTTVGSLQDNAPGHLLAAALSLGITPEMYREIPHLASAIIGVNTESEKAMKFLDDWLSEIEKVSPCISWFPEEISFSVTAHRVGCKPLFRFGSLVCNEEETSYLPAQKKTIQAYLDSRR